MNISVVICSYNPIDENLKRCLHAVEQAYRFTPINELIVIDNNSNVEIIGRDYIREFANGNPYLQVIKESRQGLTYARLKGIEHAKGDLIIFIDDDNVIDSHYFLKAVKIYREYPFIGAYSGQVTLEFEKPPPKWSERYFGMLVYREFSGNTWSNIPFQQDSMPCGAGLCVTRDVAEHYLMLHKKGKRSFCLDRTNNSLLSGGDNDLAMCASDLNKGMGVFEELKLKHIIPASRITLTYFSSLAYSIYYSEVLLRFMRNHSIHIDSFAKKLIFFLRTLFMKRESAIISRSCKKGRSDAIKKVKMLNH